MTSQWFISIQIGLFITLFASLSCASNPSNTLSPLSSLLEEETSDVRVNVLASADTSQTSQVEIELTKCPDLPSFWVGSVDGSVNRGSVFPEEEAVYWLPKLPSLSGRSGYYEFRGQYPEVRFSSYQSYTPLGTSIDSIFDFDFAPTDGSRPSFSLSEDEYVVKALPSNAPKLNSRREETAFYLGDQPQSPFYFILYRLYAPDPLGQIQVPPEFEYDSKRWRNQGQHFLPTIYYITDNVRRPHFSSLNEICSFVEENDDPNLFRPIDFFTELGNQVVPRLEDVELETGLASDRPPWFVGTTFFESIVPLFEDRPKIVETLRTLSEREAVTELIPNDANAYLVTFINREYGEILVTSFKAPTFPNTQVGEEIDSETQDTRFWSICMYQPFLLYVTGCLSDYETAIDENGYATFVFSREKDRPIDPETGSPFQNWLALPSSTSVVFYRHTLPSFRRSHVFYKKLCDPLDRECHQNYAAIRAWMGPFYPQSWYCSKEEFEQDGCQSVR